MDHHDPRTTRPTKVAFLDFDHTLTDRNSDMWVFTPSGAFTPDAKIKQEAKDYEGRDWTSAVNVGLAQLFEQGYDVSDISAHMEKLPLQENLKAFLDDLRQRGFYIIITSDSNDLFIEAAMKQIGGRGLVDEVWANPVDRKQEGDRTKLIVKHMFGSTAWSGSTDRCRSCGPSMCKGQVTSTLLDRFCSASSAPDIIIYCADGQNDLCGMIAMAGRAKATVGFVRRTYSLQKLSTKIPASVTQVMWREIGEVTAHLERMQTDVAQVQQTEAPPEAEEEAVVS